MFGLIDGDGIYGGKLRFERFAIKTVLKFSYYNTYIHWSPVPVPFMYLISTSTTLLNLVPFS